MAPDIFSTVADEGGYAPLTLGRFNSDIRKICLPSKSLTKISGRP